MNTAAWCIVALIVWTPVAFVVCVLVAGARQDRARDLEAVKDRARADIATPERNLAARGWQVKRDGEWVPATPAEVGEAVVNSRRSRTLMTARELTEQADDIARRIENARTQR